jgi:uncharacterized protein YcaQ
MQVGGRRWYGEVDRTHPHLREHVLDEIRARGPLGSRHFDGAARKGEMWGWKPAKRCSSCSGTTASSWSRAVRASSACTTSPSAFLPPETLDAPTPKEPERLRELVTRAVAGRGVLTERGIVEHWRLRGGALRVRPVVDALVDEGALERHAVEDGGPPVLVAAGTELDPPAPRAAVLLSPFDNLLWDRPFARRVLGFDHLIEVYKPAPQRRYGYYVLPLLRGDRVVGRADLKSERAEGRLVVRRFHREPACARRARSTTHWTALDRLAA